MQAHTTMSVFILWHLHQHASLKLDIASSAAALTMVLPNSYRPNHFRHTRKVAGTRIWYVL